VREKYCFRLEIYDRLRANKQADTQYKYFYWSNYSSLY